MKKNCRDTQQDNQRFMTLRCRGIRLVGIMSKPLLSPAIRFLPAESSVTLEVAHQSSEVVEAACLSETELYRTLCSSAPPPRSTPRMPGWGTPHRDGSFVLPVPVAVAGCPLPAV